MMGEKKLEPKLMYSITLLDLVPKDNFYRQLSEFLDLRFIYQECKTLYGKTGNPSIDPVVFFRLVLFGYFENIISDRELIRRASDSLGVRLYLGYDLDEELPWHSTISRTRSLIPEEVFEKLFNKILKMCIDKGLVSGEEQSIDSTLVKANASMESLEKKRPQIELSKYIDKTREENSLEPIDDRSNKGKKISDKEETSQIEFVELPKKKGRKQKRSSSSNKEYESKSDPDSRIARRPGKYADLYYMTHYSVDSKSNVITDVHTVRADRSDSSVLLEVVERTEQRLEKEGLTIKVVAADKKYCSGVNLRDLESKGIAAFIPKQSQPNTKGGIDKSNFIYDKENDLYICPEGNRLEHYYTKKKKEAKVYSVKKKECFSCPIKDKCSPGTHLRRIQHSVYRAEYDRLFERLRSCKGKRMRRIRQITTEPLFAEAKENHSLRKFMTKGIDKARKNSLMIASVQNLKRLMKFTKRKLANEARMRDNNPFMNSIYRFIFKPEYCFI